MAEQTRQNSNNANKANELSIKVKTDAQEGNQQMAGMLTAINETADALNKIVEGVSDTVQIVGMIAESSVRQASSISQIDKGINQVSQV